MDLLTTPLQVITTLLLMIIILVTAVETSNLTTLLLISTLYKSSQHQLSLFPTCCVFISCSLAAASNSGDSSASRTQVLSSQLSVQNCLSTDNSQLPPRLAAISHQPPSLLFTGRLSANCLLTNSSLITSQHRPHKHLI
jgi:hypothetical protein